MIVKAQDLEVWASSRKCLDKPTEKCYCCYFEKFAFMGFLNNKIWIVYFEMALDKF